MKSTTTSKANDNIYGRSTVLQVNSPQIRRRGNTLADWTQLCRPETTEPTLTATRMPTPRRCGRLGVWVQADTTQ